MLAGRTTRRKWGVIKALTCGTCLTCLRRLTGNLKLWRDSNMTTSTMEAGGVRLPLSAGAGCPAAAVLPTTLRTGDHLARVVAIGFVCSIMAYPTYPGISDLYTISSLLVCWRFMFRWRLVQSGSQAASGVDELNRQRSRCQGHRKNMPKNRWRIDADGWRLLPPQHCG